MPDRTADIRAELVVTGKVIARLGRETVADQSRINIVTLKAAVFPCGQAGAVKIVTTGLHDIVRGDAGTLCFGALRGSRKLDFLIGAEIVETHAPCNAVVGSHFTAGASVDTAAEGRRATHLIATDVVGGDEHTGNHCRQSDDAAAPWKVIHVAGAPVERQVSCAASRSIVGAWLVTVTSSATVATSIDPLIVMVAPACTTTLSTFRVAGNRVAQN